MSNSQYVSTAQVAKALGVSVSTVKRWVDEAILPAHKTAGGHRKLLIADVVRLARDGNFPRLNLSLLQAKEVVSPCVETTVLAREFHRALRAGDETRARAVIWRCHHDGMAVATLADEVVRPAMVRVGHEWEVGHIDVLHEHRATQMCGTALFELKLALQKNAVDGAPVAVGGAPEGDPYFLPSLLIELVLIENGWKAVNLGPNTPLTSMKLAVETWQPKLLWLTASNIDNAERFRADCTTLFRAAEQAGTAVVIGGRAFTESVRHDLPYTTFGDGMLQLATFARTLNPLPSRPRRGRPRGLRLHDSEAS